MLQVAFTVIPARSSGSTCLDTTMPLRINELPTFQVDLWLEGAMLELLKFLIECGLRATPWQLCQFLMLGELPKAFMC